jgi:murein DD-endopeptidase MepM/ murein hydrolase activator NlpD
MHIIITDAWMAKQRAMHINGWRVMALGFVLAFALVLSAVAVYNWVLLEGMRRGWPVFQSWSKVVSPQSTAGNDVYMRENLDALARKLGEMQARMLQIDALGDRVAGLAGINPEEFKKPQGAGGSLVQGQPMTLDEIMAVANGLERVSDTRMDWLTAVETRLFDQKMQTALQPTEKPVKDVMIGSRFGFRIDPFSGERAMHTGLDFPAEVGTPILAAAGGVVIVQEYHGAYGNMVEVDHGNGLITRYAHASATFVKKGDIVKRGQKIASVGSTGRSTGPHLHFEVWVSGVPQDPQRFLAAGEDLAKSQALAARRTR